MEGAPPICPNSQPIPRLRPDQQAIAGHPARFKVVACGRRWGKTTLGLALAAEQARQGARVWWVAPTYGLAFHPWRAVKAAFAGQWTHKLEAERFVELEGGGTITVKSADDPDGLRGVGLDFVVVDEAAFVTEEAWGAALRPALADRRGRALLISTPRGRNWFYHAHQRGLDPLFEDWMAWRYPTAANPLILPAEIDEARAILPARIFQQEYEAEFLADGGEVFHNVQAAATAPAGAVYQPGHRYLMGIDFGRYLDFTAVVVLDAGGEFELAAAPAMVALDRFNEVNWARQRARIARLAGAWGVQAILAEANAMGEPNIEALRAEGLPVSSFTTTARSKPLLIETLVKAIEERAVALLPDPVLIAELEAYTYTNDRHTGRTRYSAPPGLHDDTVIALALAWWLASTPRLALAVAEV